MLWNIFHVFGHLWTPWVWLGMRWWKLVHHAVLQLLGKVYPVADADAKLAELKPEMSFVETFGGFVEFIDFNFGTVQVFAKASLEI
jgi:hypothetical protein